MDKIKTIHEVNELWKCEEFLVQICTGVKLNEIQYTDKKNIGTEKGN